MTIQISDLIGIPYKDHGRTAEGMDCYGLAIEVMRRYGYKVVHIDLIHPERSDKYNPLNYVHNTDDVLKLANQIVTLGYNGMTARKRMFERRVYHAMQTLRSDEPGLGRRGSGIQTLLYLLRRRA